MNKQPGSEKTRNRATFSLDAPAKINIGLRITGRRSDGYHTIKTLFHTIDLCDTIEFRPATDEKIHFTSIDEGAPEDASNLAYKAAELLRRRCGVSGGAALAVRKRIPVAAGLGGGSSDAAAVLRGLNKVWELGLSLDELEIIGLELGADVPFFVRGGSQYAQGIGEELSSGSVRSVGAVVVVVPDVRISTAQAYAEAKLSLTTGRNAFKLEAFDLLSDSKLYERFKNDFEEVVSDRFPEIIALKDALILGGARFASLTGTGAAVYGLFSSMKKAVEVDRMFTSPQRVFVTTLRGSETERQTS